MKKLLPSTSGSIILYYFKYFTIHPSTLHWHPRGKPTKIPRWFDPFLPGETAKSSSLKGNLCNLCEIKAIELGLEGYEMEVSKGSVITHLKAEFNNKFESRKTSCAGKYDKFMTLQIRLKNVFWV